MVFEPVIGLEVHVELSTRTKMFCGCTVVDTTRAEPNRSVCEICTGMPGTLPVVNQRAVELALRVALALGSTVAEHSVFARKNYFYPDLPKGFQISQYEAPLAAGGALAVPDDGPFDAAQGRRERRVRIQRVHLEEDTGKLVHREQGSLVDYNRSGVPLLEIVSEPDLYSVDQAKAYATELRSLLRTLDVTSGDMEKGAIRFEANISLRPAGQAALGTRTEIKNLNSFRAMVRAVAFEIERQSRLLADGNPIDQETRGWDDAGGRTLPQRDKEDAHDYRYFPEPDLPPLHVDPAWLERIRRSLPELPQARRQRLTAILGLPPRLAAQLAEDPSVADYFDRAIAAAPAVPPAKIANWITGELFALLHASNTEIAGCRVEPAALGELVAMVDGDYINPPTGKAVLQRIFDQGGLPSNIVEAEGLAQVSDADGLDRLIRQVLRENAEQVRQYQQGKTAVGQWLFGQVMRLAGGKAKPGLVQERLQAQLEAADPQK
jgi:aspartyl-tRNA(Asn)/glutamyl-tRNA(Gln) amidotransferase subunit B